MQEALRDDRITEFEFGVMLGITDRRARDGFLKVHGVDLAYTAAAFEREQSSLRELRIGAK